MTDKGLTEWVKVKKGKLEKIKEPSAKEIERLRDDGYSVSKSVTRGNKTKITTYSPISFAEHRNKEFNLLHSKKKRKEAYA